MDKEAYYESISSDYQIGKTRLRKIMSLAGSGSGRKILDVGCASGYVGAAFKKQGDMVVGIDISPEAATAARKVLDHVAVFNIEEEWPSLPGAPFDIAVLAEVIEHVFDPIQLLTAIHHQLKPGGLIIISTPNLLSWPNRIRFIFGKFRYERGGMFDFGHIRFFTIQYLYEVLKGSGFEVVAENHIIYPGRFSRFLKSWPGMFARQFVLKAIKRDL